MRKFAGGIFLILSMVFSGTLLGRDHHLCAQPVGTHWVDFSGISQSEKPFLAHNVIVMIGDGMGPEQVKAGGIYLNGAPGSLSFEDFPFQAKMTTYSANNCVTDSAAAATALATGHKVNNGVVDQALPGKGDDLHTLLEYARDHGMSTGLVTNGHITSATPAGFGAHAANRYETAQIAESYLHGSRPNVLFGGGGIGMDPDQARQAGYQVVTDRASLLALDTEQANYISGQFGSGSMPYERDGLGSLPHLVEMASVALNIVDNNPNGLFLMIEGDKIDEAGHAYDTAHLVDEVAEFSRTVQQVLGWANSHPDTLIVVLADHETGGFRVLKNNGAGQVPLAAWTAFDHTATDVGLYLYSPVKINLPPVVDNTDLPYLLTMGHFQP